MTTPRPSHRRAGGGRPALIGRDDIVAAAIAVIDADGLDAMTMRRLGTELGVAAMSVYRHLPGRDAVLAAVVNRLAAAASTEFEPGQPWPDAVRRFATAYRRMLLDHPNAVPLLATHPVDIDTGLAMLADLLDSFRAADIPQTDALTVLQSAVVFTLGHALTQVGTPPGADTATEAADAETERFYQDWYTTALDAMIAGFQSQLDARPSNG